MLRLYRIHAADRLIALNTPGNRLERLKGDRQGQYSIRINDKCRICFEWPEDSPGPLSVEIEQFMEPKILLTTLLMD
jgi:proteic killer suppression protein